MRFSSIFAASAVFLASTSFAAPAPPNGWNGKGKGGPPSVRPNRGPQRPTCMSDEDADIVADSFRQLIQGYTKEMALAALTEDFVDYSSAVSIIINKGGSAPKDVTVPIFTSRAQFMEGHGKQQPIPFETLKVWHDCNGTVSMRWMTTRSAFGQPKESAAIPVLGQAVLETQPAEENNPLGYNYRIHTLYSEFNTAAWLVNNGVFKPNATVTPVPQNATKAVTPRDAIPENQEMKWYDVGLI